jgi:hypothetical protein
MMTTLICLRLERRYCELSEAIHSSSSVAHGLLRSARNDGVEALKLWLFEFESYAIDWARSHHMRVVPANAETHNLRCLLEQKLSTARPKNVRPDALKFNTALLMTLASGNARSFAAVC